MSVEGCIRKIQSSHRHDQLSTGLNFETRSPCTIYELRLCQCFMSRILKSLCSFVYFRFRNVRFAPIFERCQKFLPNPKFNLNLTILLLPPGTFNRIYRTYFLFWPFKYSLLPRDFVLLQDAVYLIKEGSFYGRGYICSRWKTNFHGNTKISNDNS